MFKRFILSLFRIYGCEGPINLSLDHVKKALDGSASKAVKRRFVSEEEKNNDNKVKTWFNNIRRNATFIKLPMWSCLPLE